MLQEPKKHVSPPGMNERTDGSDLSSLSFGFNSPHQRGWYDFSWAEGSFPVCFRPGGAFYCPKFPQGATWNLDGSVVKIDWKRFGTLELLPYILIFSSSIFCGGFPPLGLVW